MRLCAVVRYVYAHIQNAHQSTLHKCSNPRRITFSDVTHVGFRKSVSDTWNFLRTGSRTSRNIDLIEWHGAPCKWVSVSFNLGRGTNHNSCREFQSCFCDRSSHFLLLVFAVSRTCVHEHASVVWLTSAFLVEDAVWEGSIIGICPSSDAPFLKINACLLICFPRGHHASGTSFTFEKCFRDVWHCDGLQDLSRLPLTLYPNPCKKLYFPPREQCLSSSTECSIALLSHVFVSL